MDLGRPLRFARAFAQGVLGANRSAQALLDGSRAAVLMYHRVLPRADAQRSGVPPGMYVTPETFAHHLDWLGERFRILPLHEIAACLESGRSLPPGACAITFDDGWRDNAQHALPALARRGLPATIFVVSERVGTQGAFWPDEVSRRMTPLRTGERRRLAERLGAAGGGDPLEALIEHLKGLSEAQRGATLDALRAEIPQPKAEGPELADWSELSRLASAGVDIESHGATHAILRGLDRVSVERELRTAAESLRARGHGRHRLLAYPNGDHDALVREVAREQGYHAAVTTERGLAHLRGDPMAIPRLALHDDVSRTRVEFLQRLR
jgi:peptidoglycan/xylan/chitin deacetylase (PgdA/CDA1 family)